MVLSNEMRENVETIRENGGVKESRREVHGEHSNASIERRRRVKSARRQRQPSNFREETKIEIGDETSYVSIEVLDRSVISGGEESRKEVNDDHSNASMERRRRMKTATRQRQTSNAKEESKREIDDETSNVSIEGHESPENLERYPINVDQAGIETDNETTNASNEVKKREERERQPKNAEDEIDDLETGRTSGVMSEDIITNIQDLIAYHSERTRSEIKAELRECNTRESKRTVYTPIMIIFSVPAALLALVSVAWFFVAVAKRFDPTI